MITKETQVAYNSLYNQIINLLSNLEGADRVLMIHDSLMQLRQLCPHKDHQIDYTTTGECPYCGAHFDPIENEEEEE